MCYTCKHIEYVHLLYNHFEVMDVPHTIVFHYLSILRRGPNFNQLRLRYSMVFKNVKIKELDKALNISYWLTLVNSLVFKIRLVVNSGLILWKGNNNLDELIYRQIKSFGFLYYRSHLIVALWIYNEIWSCWVRNPSSWKQKMTLRDHHFPAMSRWFYIFKIWLSTGICRLTTWYKIRDH